MAARLVRNGWRVEQTSNAYILCPAAAAPATDLQIARAVKNVLKMKESIEVVPADPTERQAAETALKAARERPRLLATLLKGENTAGMTDKTGWELEEKRVPSTRSHGSRCGMVKRRCSWCEYLFAAPADSHEPRCPDCVRVGVPPRRRRGQW